MHIVYYMTRQYYVGTIVDIENAIIAYTVLYVGPVQHIMISISSWTSFERMADGQP